MEISKSVLGKTEEQAESERAKPVEKLTEDGYSGDIVTMRIIIPIGYEEDILNHFSIEKTDELSGYNKKTKEWTIDVDLKTATVRNWKKGVSGYFFDKIRDKGSYCLLDSFDNVVKYKHHYVPNKAIPPKKGFDDYIELNIDANGKITNWYETPDFSAFKDKDFIDVNTASAEGLSCQRKTDFAPNSFLTALNNKNVDKLVEVFNSLLASIPFDNFSETADNSVSLSDCKPAAHESLYRSMLLAFMRGCGVKVSAEVHNCLGRSDLIVQHNGIYWVLEIKVIYEGEDPNKTAEEALQQIIDKQYAVPYFNVICICIGLAIDDATRQITKKTVTTRNSEIIHGK
jgi:hypothetical protein